MLLLFETPAGYSLFKVKDEKKLQDAEVRATRARSTGRATRRDATNESGEKARAIDAAAVGRATRARRAVGDAATRDAREGSRGRSWTRDGATGGRAGGRARSEGAIRSIREGIGELGIGGRRARGRGRRTRGRGRD